jgi:hypothetical protein
MKWCNLNSSRRPILYVEPFLKKKNNVVQIDLRVAISEEVGPSPGWFYGLEQAGSL